MPNYVQNTIIVSGDPKVLQYFYERNRVTKEDVEMLGLHEGDEVDLSFEKCIPRVQEEIFIDFVNDNFLPKNIQKIEDIRVLHEIFPSMVMNHIHNLFWSTKSDTIEPTCYLDTIENGTITYTFDTAWSFPKNWLISISKIFKNLDFQITYSKEDDGYDLHYVYHYKDGIQTKVKEHHRENEDLESESES
jgi:hypothetical protein